MKLQNTKNRQKKAIITAMCSSLLIGLTACGGGSGGGGNTSSGPGGSTPNNGQGGDKVALVLNSFGVDTSQSPRLSNTGTDLPDSYSPLGAVVSLNQTQELLLFGFSPSTLPSSKATYMEINSAGTTQSPSYNPAVLANIRNPQPTWIAPPQNQSKDDPQSTRAVTVGDIDGDGLQETIVAYIDVDDPAHDQELYFKVIDDAEATIPYAESTSFIALEAGTKDIEVMADDFNGDGIADIVVALSNDRESKLLFVTRDANGTFVVDINATKILTPSTAGSVISTEMSVGNVDYDNSQELVVVMNEHIGVTGQETGVSRYFVYDDANTGHNALVSAKTVQGQSNGIHSAVVGDVSLGDIDGDNLDEIVIGGLTEFHMDCSSNGYVFTSLDDAEHLNSAGEFVSIGDHYLTNYFTGCVDNDPWIIRGVHVNTLDLDGDGVDEIQVNQFIFDNWKKSAAWTKKYEIDEREFFDNNGAGYLSHSTTAIAVADVLGDGRENIVLFSQSGASRNGSYRVSILGESQIQNNKAKPVLSLMTSIPILDTGSFPLLALPNVTKDGMVLKYTDSSYKLVFTEPVILAALAAAPCQEGIGQNLNGCTTSFGQAASSSASKSKSITLSASASVGFKVDGGVFTQSEASAKVTVSTAVTFSSGTAYTLEKLIVYNTGAIEDTVIFTTIPYDQYTYTVLSHPDAAMIGKSMVISMPRDPITFQAERQYYNDSVGEDDLKIGDNVFQHTPGDVSSYPTSSAAPFTVLESPLVAVGPGSGNTITQLQLTQEFSKGNALAIEFEVAVEATAGTILGGFTVGAGAENSLTITNSNSTIYTGSVGSISQENFQANRYSFGLFTYVYEDVASNQKFEVLNYWVER